MENAAAIEALLRIRGDLVADLRAAEKERLAHFRRLAKLDTDLRAIGGPEFDPPREVSRRRQLFRRGELRRLVLSLTRELGPETENRRIAELTFQRVGIFGPSQKMVERLSGQVGRIRRQAVVMERKTAGS
jgi:hypothetical protein